MVLAPSMELGAGLRLLADDPSCVAIDAKLEKNRFLRVMRAPRLRLFPKWRALRRIEESAGTSRIAHFFPHGDTR